MKYKARIKDCHLVVRAKASLGEAVDTEELERFSRVYLRGFLKPTLIRKNMVEYTGPVGISLAERLRKPMTKRDFFLIIEQIVVSIRKLDYNRMPLNHLLMDLQHVYINEVTKEVQFLYVPTVKPVYNGNAMSMVESIVYSVIPADPRDGDFVARFIYFFRSLKFFDAAKVEGYIAREAQSVVSTVTRQNASQSGFMTNKQKSYYDHYEQKQQQAADEEATGLLEDDDSTGLLEEETDAVAMGSDDATGLLDENEATGLLDESNETAVLDDEGAEETALLVDTQPVSQPVRFPTLLRVLTGEAITVNKPVFRLGKERSYVDYFVNNNAAVSRSHADIITRGGRYYVMDLNSKNHTFINGQETPVHCELEIMDGDHLRLGNEEFIFQT